MVRFHLVDIYVLFMINAYRPVLIRCSCTTPLVLGSTAYEARGRDAVHLFDTHRWEYVYHLGLFRMGHVEVVKSLIGNDASIGFGTNKKEQTVAVKGKQEGIVLELVRPDPKVLSFDDNKGNTPLHIAIKKSRTKINLNSLNKAGDTALDIAEKIGNAELALALKKAGAATAKDLGKPQNPAKQLKQTVRDIRHEVQSQIQQSRQTGAKVQRIEKRLKKLHINSLNNAINSATVVAVLIATDAFAVIFTIPGQYEEDITNGPLVLVEARIANQAPFLLFFIFNSLAVKRCSYLWWLLWFRHQL
ncbi:unnamed protein product [Eruca vesicaria subsp. sativa]|uniref:PGG domain-containing protein n=1 Tax=Eruca vesicaria subsp. sativa TaxID=29727 RepID=A0ABC8JD79_ERUVS|nr:unnamed protein product [Eruca vesicaria subsp. sativa]